MRTERHWPILWVPLLLLLLSCTNSARIQDLVNDPFPEAQAELSKVVDAIADDAMAANIEGIQALHLNSPKFTKFGPRSFDRQDVSSTRQRSSVQSPTCPIGQRI